MGKYFSIVDGKVLDWKWKQSKHQDFVWRFYVGDTFVGQVFRSRVRTRTHWCAVAWGDCPNGLRRVDGFRTRHDAAEYMLRVTGLQKDDSDLLQEAVDKVEEVGNA
jgi:hypothetical protein